VYIGQMGRILYVKTWKKSNFSLAKLAFIAVLSIIHDQFHTFPSHNPAPEGRWKQPFFGQGLNIFY
jgi:hypothetical protein